MRTHRKEGGRGGRGGEGREGGREGDTCRLVRGGAGVGDLVIRKDRNTSLHYSNKEIINVWYTIIISSERL